MNKKILLLLGVIVLSSGLVASLMLSRGHNWGDDFAAYILQAQSLVRGSVGEFIKSNTFTIEQSSYRFSPIIYPWGFPLLLAPVYAIFGMKILAFKALLTCCYMLFLAAFFLLARTRTSDIDAVLVTAFMAFNLRMLDAQNEILADLPFLMWSTISLWLVERYASNDWTSGAGIGFGVLTGLAISMAAITRFNGVILFGALAAAQFLSLRANRRSNGYTARQLRFAAIPYAVFGLCYGTQALLLPQLGSGLVEPWQTFSLQGLLHNLWYYFVLPGDFLQESMLGGNVLYAVLLVFFALTVAQRRTRDAPLLLYGLATVVLYVSFPLTQGPRYIFPILPIFFLFAFQGMKEAAGKLRPGLRRRAVSLLYTLWIGLAVVSLGASLVEARDNLLRGRQDADGPFSTGAIPMFSFIRNATPADSVIVFRKPRAMHLFTDRDSILASDCADLAKGNFVVIAKERTAYDQLPLDRIEACDASVSLTRVSGKGDFVIYSISPRPPG